MSGETEIGRCGHCGHAVFESHLPPGSALAQCPGCGAEVQPSIARVQVGGSSRSRAPADVSSAPVREATGSLTAPEGYLANLLGAQLELSLPDPRPRNLLQQVGPAIFLAFIAADSLKSIDNVPLVVAAGVLTLVGTLAFFQNRPVRLELLRGRLRIRKKEQRLQIDDVVRAEAQLDGLGARLVVERRDGTSRDVLNGLEELAQAEWLAEQLNLALRVTAPSSSTREPEPPRPVAAGSPADAAPVAPAVGERAD